MTEITCSVSIIRVGSPWCCKRKKNDVPAPIASMVLIGPPDSCEQKRHVIKLKWDEQKRCIEPIYWGRGRHAFIFYASINRRPIGAHNNYNRNSASIMNAAASLLSTSTQKKFNQLHQSIILWWQDLGRNTWNKLASTFVRSFVHTKKIQQNLQYYYHFSICNQFKSFR